VREEEGIEGEGVGAVGWEDEAVCFRRSADRALSRWKGKSFEKEEDGRTFGQKKVIAVVPVRDIDLLAWFCRFVSVVLLINRR